MGIYFTKSIKFGERKLDNKSCINIKIISHRESCGTHTVKILENRLKTLGYDVTCTDNYK